MYQIFFFLTIFLSYHHVSAQPPPPPFENGDLVNNFEPSLAVVIGVLAIVFTLTFALLVYAKSCNINLRSGTIERRWHVNRFRPEVFYNNRSTNTSDRFSGLDKTVIESLPLFRFSALKGAKQGLECSVCISKFESFEILRLLPKCRHAFHIGCIDQWLEKQATCPLCRDIVSVEDEDGSSVSYENSFRFLNQSERSEDLNLELYIEREEEEEEVGRSLRFNIGESFRKILKLGHKEKQLLDQQGNDKDEKKLMHKFNHRIVVSDVVFKNRWSNVTSSDMMFLNSEMVDSISSERFSSIDILRITEEIEEKRETGSKSRNMVETGRRSVSEITTVPRQSIGVNGEFSGSTAASELRNGENETEERRRRLWLPIARKTAQWFANRETKLTQNIDV